MVAWAATGTNKKNQINHLTPSHHGHFFCEIREESNQQIRGQANFSFSRIQ